jgi:hypothetical protein
MGPSRLRAATPALAATLAVGLTLSPLFAGCEPVGHDPDLLYRPIKTELARALGQGRLPFWSDRFGLGLPLVAESHVAALYPPNLLLYTIVPVPIAYRLAMWAHYMALAATTFLYARALGLVPWGAAVTALAFALCGFQAAHSCHEPFYHAMPYLPLTLFLARRYLTTGQLVWLPALALALGAQWTLGHFQIQVWTNLLVLFLSGWQIVAERRPLGRGGAVLGAVGWGLAVASLQLVLTRDYVAFVGFNRGYGELTSYAFPAAHWPQPALPRLFLGLGSWVGDSYWIKHGTTAVEACFYVGTVPLILAFVALAGPARHPGLRPWRLVAPIAWLLAVSPQLGPDAQYLIARLPLVGLFRAPGRFTALASLGLCLLAGEGLERAVPARRFRRGLGLALLFAIAGAAWGAWLAARPEFRASLGAEGLGPRLASAAIAWAVSLLALLAWRRGGLGAAGPFALTALELSILFYGNGRHDWGWAIPSPARSPAFQVLERERGVGLIGGNVDNAPVRVGLTTAYPRLGIYPPVPNYLLYSSKDALASSKSDSARWLRRLGMTHAVWNTSRVGRRAELLWTGPDPVLDRLFSPTPNTPEPCVWRVVRYPGAFPRARVALRAVVCRDWETMFSMLSLQDAEDQVWFTGEDRPPDLNTPRAHRARLTAWDGQRGTVEHDGSCELVLNRTFAPGWFARINDGPEHPVLRAEGGIQAIHLTGSGTSRVAVRYQPRGLVPAAWLSALATAAAVLALGVALRRGGRPTLLWRLARRLGSLTRRSRRDRRPSPG